MASHSGNDLDDPRLYAELDPSGLRDRIRDLPNHCIAAWRESQACTLPGISTTWTKVVIGGMGGSAIAGDLVADLASLQRTLPILVVRDHSFPYLLDDHSLFVACSYSGNTQETLSLFQSAVDANAAVVAITSGGILAQEANKQRVPLLTVGVSVEPRCAVGYNLMLILGLLQRLRLMQIEEQEVEDAVNSLSLKGSHLIEEVPAQNNLAKQLAKSLQDKQILVYGSGLYAGMARRWKSQFNENSKVWSFSETIPEVLHNSVVAFDGPGALGGNNTALLLQPASGTKDSSRHYQVLSELLRRRNIPYQVLQEPAGPPLSQLLGMLLLGDYVSYYLALLQGIDPSPTPAITVAKELLSQPPQIC